MSETEYVADLVEQRTEETVAARKACAAQSL